jgi:hypothetical protein
MPGSELCGRCGTSLRLASVAIDVHPPRAGRWTKRVRRVTPRVPVRSPATAALRTLTDRTTAALSLRLSDSTPALPLLLRCPVPGWPQLYARSRVLGRVFLYSWLLLMAVWLLFFYGTTFGSMLLGLAFSAHSSSVADATNRILEPTSVRRRIAYSICTSALLFGFLYLPAGRVLFRYADPMVLQMAPYPFEAGDVVLVNHSAFARSAPKPGQVVLFTPDDFRMPDGGHRYTVYTGPRVDRILAGPGDIVRWSHRRLTVNGRPSLLEPLNSAVVQSPFAVTVPADTYLILPSTTPYVGPAMKGTDLANMSLIPADRIRGTVYLLSHPLSRLKLLR